MFYLWVTDLIWLEDSSHHNEATIRLDHSVFTCQAMWVFYL